MKLTISVLVVIIALTITSAVSYQIGSARAKEKIFAASFYDIYRASAYQAYFVARGREDIYFAMIDPLVRKYPEFIEAAKELAITPHDMEGNEKLVARYYLAKGESIPAVTAALLSKVPREEPISMPDLPSRENIRAMKGEDLNLAAPK